MPNNSNKKQTFTFIKGLNTEAGYLAGAEDTWRDGDNVIPNLNGTVFKRPRFDIETGATYTPTINATQASEGAFVIGEWNSVGGDSALNFVVAQVNATIYFYQNIEESISPTRKSFTIDLASYKPSGNGFTAGVAPVQCISANGKLIIVSRDIEPLLVTYTPSPEGITVTAITIQIRDLYGVDDAMSVTNRPASLSDAHKYNLFNQGWSLTNINAYQAGAAVYPSNAQIWTAGKDASDNFSQALLDKQDFGTSPAPRGRYILNAFSQDRATASGIGTITTVSVAYRPTTAAFFAGRAWYAGVISSTMSSWLFFSQVADTSDKYGRCYQDADPTSEFISDLIDTDGGVIPIQDCGTIRKLLPFGQSLLVFADNGLWMVQGVDTGFSASGYRVVKISSVGCVSAQSIVEADNTVFWWSNGGINMMTTGEGAVGADIGKSVTSITDNTIRTLYTNIPGIGRANASGRYHDEDKRVYWVYGTLSEMSATNNRFKKDKVLVLDLRLRCFYTFTINAAVNVIMDVWVTKGRQQTQVATDVIDASLNNVIDAAGNNVVVNPVGIGLFSGNTILKGFCMVPDSTNFKFTCGDFLASNETSPRKFRDWYRLDNVGKTYEAYVVGQYEDGEIGKDREIQGVYLTAYMNRTETEMDSNGVVTNPSKVWFQNRWNWTDTSSANKWSEERQIYRILRPMATPSITTPYDNGQPLVVTKNKIRGRGKVVQFKFRADTDADMQLVGWSVTYLGNQNA